MERETGKEYAGEYEIVQSMEIGSERGSNSSSSTGRPAACTTVLTSRYSGQAVQATSLTDSARYRVVVDPSLLTMWPSRTPDAPEM